MVLSTCVKPREYPVALLTPEGQGLHREGKFQDAETLVGIFVHLHHMVLTLQGLRNGHYSRVTQGSHQITRLVRIFYNPFHNHPHLLYL